MASAPACIGLTGGIGSGKSAALLAFARRGAAVLSADDVVHGLYADPNVVDAVVERFGASVMGPDAQVNRAALSAVAMAQDGGMRFLEALLHPRIGQAREAWVAQQRARHPAPPLLVCEVPLLFEAGLKGLFDVVVVVTAPEAVRRARVEARGQDFDARAALQWDEDRKVAAADAWYMNDGSEKELASWVDAQFNAWESHGAA